MIKPFHTLHPPFWFILGGSLCEDLELFQSFKTSPRSSKSESGCESYACFTFGAAAVFVLAGCPGFSPDVRPLLSRGHLVCVKLLDVRLLAWVSGRRYPQSMLKCWFCLPDVRHLSGCLGLCQMSGPCTLALFFCVRVHISQPPDVRPDTSTCTPTTIFALPLYVAFFHPGRRLSKHINMNPRIQKGSLSLLLHQILDPEEIRESS